jgi:CheY-like chemotaxis protein
VEGISAYRAGGFDVVITDIVMPRMEGIETVRALRDADGIVKIIAMSGCARDGAALYLAAAEALGADASLVKPFTPEELRRAVRLALSEPAAAGQGTAPLS